MSLNGTLSTAGRSLEVFSAGVQVTGENIANSGTPGYIREEIALETGGSYSNGNLLFGIGVLGQGVQQQIDLYLEGRLYSASTDAAAADARQEIYKQLEVELRELGDSDLSTSLSEFQQSLANLADEPESDSLRSIAVQQGQELANDILDLRARVDQLQQDQTGRIGSLVEEANGLIDEIARLNPRIAGLEAASNFSSDAGGERSQRYAAMSRLAEIVPVRFRENPSGTVDVYSGSNYLLLTGSTQHLEVTRTSENGTVTSSVVVSVTQADVSRSGGEIRGLIEGRDDILGGFVEQLDQFASGLISEFNRLHASGEGTAAFSTLTSLNEVSDTSAALNVVDLPTTPEHGEFEVKIQNELTGLVETTTIPIDLDGIGADTSLDDLQATLDAIPNLSATVTPRGQLQLDAASGYTFSFANDSSGVLAGLGLNTFFTGADSSSIGVNAAIVQNADLLATGQGGGPSDGRNASRLAEFLDGPVEGFNGRTLTEFYESVVTDVAQSAASEETLSQGLATYRDSLQSQRDQFSGVSLDEEALKLIEFQHSYQAAARIISTVDELMQVMLNL
ncbi:flagellar hook-associated protein FlgK [Thalassoroseus pseudoceratinae]|uniref:flagellar hook-associated protein FlgK n=1 Tax=Thalassoroseus pseudoceratinae TaxID=2713176 RepID=UPI0014236007|nr:flagellar hook-associated protein FlgK [Thalassoroseus pseudoceratinae]